MTLSTSTPPCSARDERPYDYMDMPRDQRGFMYADKVMKDGKVVGVSTSRG